MTRPGPILAALYTWLLPFAVAAAGFGVHYALHVPKGPLPPPSPQKVEDDRKAADKKKKEEERKKKEADRKAGKKTKPERGARELPYEPFTRPRQQYLIDQLWAYYEPEDFKKEPTFDAWQTAHKPLLAQIVQNTRQLGLSPAPALNVVGTECHTIRCRFAVTGNKDDLERIVPLLRDLQLDGGSLWHQFKADEPVVDKKDTGGRFKVQVTVSLMRDLPALTAIQLPGKGTLASARPTPPAPAPSAPPPTATPPAAPVNKSTSQVPGAAPPGYVDPTGAPLRSPTGPAPKPGKPSQPVKP